MLNGFAQKNSRRNDAGAGAVKIQTEAEYEAALVEVERLIDLDPAPRTADGEKLDALTNALLIFERGISDCCYCRDSEPKVLDEDGILSSLSGKLGRWSHANLDGHWQCEDPPGPDPDPLPYKFIPELIAEGKAQPHDDCEDEDGGVFVDGKCLWCGEKDPEYRPENPNQAEMGL